MIGIIETIVCGFIVFIIYIAYKESGEKDSKIRKLQVEKERLLDKELNRRFKNIHGISFNEAYESSENKKKWDELTDKVKSGQLHYQPDYYDFIANGLFSSDKSKQVDILLDLEDDYN